MKRSGRQCHPYTRGSSGLTGPAAQALSPVSAGFLPASLRCNPNGYLPVVREIGPFFKAAITRSTVDAETTRFQPSASR